MAIGLAWRKPDYVCGSSAPAIMVGAFAATGGLLFGYDTGSISGILAMGAFRRDFSTGHIDANAALNFTPAQTATIVSILSAGTFFGALLAAPMGDQVGRRLSLIVAVAIFSFGVLLQVCATAVALLVAGRLFAGLGVGIVSVLVPLYQSEMAPKWIRGTLVCAYQLAITCGLLVAAIINIATQSLESSASYKIPLALQFVWAAVLLVGLCFLPETPRYLIKAGLHEKAAIALSRLRRLDVHHPTIVEEIAEIEANHRYELRLGPSTYRDAIFGSPHLGRRLLTGCALQMLQQLSGCNFIFYYGTTFFENIGLSSPFTIQLITNAVNVLSTIPGMFLVEILGRRRLLMSGGAGMAICQFIVAGVGMYISDSRDGGIVLIVFVCAYLFFFAASWGPVAWVVTSEIYPLKVRAKSMSLSTASNWMLNFGIAYGTPYLVNAGPGSANLKTKVFFVWGTFCVISVIFVWLQVFETSKLSLEQIDELFQRCDSARQSRDFQPSWSFQQMVAVGASASGVPPATPASAPAAAPATTPAAEVNVEAEDGEGYELRQRPTTTSSGSASDNAMTVEEKIIASIGEVDLSY